MWICLYRKITTCLFGKKENQNSELILKVKNRGKKKSERKHGNVFLIYWLSDIYNIFNFKMYVYCTYILVFYLIFKC